MIQNTLSYLRAVIGTKIKDKRGQAMAEYGLILALIACFVIAAVTLIGTNLDTKFREIVTALTT